MVSKKRDNYSDDNKLRPERPKGQGVITDKQYKYEQILIKIRQLLSDALACDGTSADESIDMIYEALELCDVLDE